MNKRIKEIRKREALTLKQFGKKLGVSDSAISRIENGDRNLTEQMLLSVCREFDVNEEWLRTGKGDMYIIPIAEEAEIISELIEKDNPIYDLVKDIVRKYKKLDPKSKKVLEDFCQDLMSKDERRSK